MSARRPKVVLNETAIDLGAPGLASITRMVRDAVYRGRVVGREVVTHPLDMLLIQNKISGLQHQAGMRIRASIEGSWPAQQVTARGLYVSEAGEHDEAENEPDEAEQYAEQKRLHADRVWAEKLCGARCWLTVSHVCAGGTVVSQAAMVSLVTGLTSLVEGWGVKSQDR